MIVMKFGGTSVEDAASIERVAEIIRARLALSPVVVVSAMGKTTRRLVAAAESSAGGDRRASLDLVAELRATHEREARRLVRAPGRPVFGLIRQYFEELATLLEGLAILGEVPPRGLDKILAYGELLSSAIVADALAERGIQSHLLDARTFVKTDDRYGSASPLFDVTNKLAREAIGPLVRSNDASERPVDNRVVPVVQGYIGSTRGGATTTLGFEGSDYTATILGAALGVDDIQIWKDVSGLMTADPAVFPAARTVKMCTFGEAAELTYFGAKVLHPKAIHPAARQGIPVHIYNSKRPDATGTEITAHVPASANVIKSIAYKRPVTIVKATAGAGWAENVASRGMLGVGDGPVRPALEALAARRLSPLITAVSGPSVALAIDSTALDGRPDLIEELSALGEASAEGGKAIVSLVGEDLRSRPDTVARVSRAIEDVPLAVVIHGSSPITMNLVIAASDVEAVVARLHDAFFDQLDPVIFE
jgi:aspartate kinase